MTLTDVLGALSNNITARGAGLAAVFAAIAHIVLTMLGYTAGETAVLFATPRKVSLDAETAKTLLTMLAAVIGVLADRSPEFLAYLKTLFGKTGSLPDDEIKERLTTIEANTTAILQKLDGGEPAAE